MADHIQINDIAPRIQYTGDGGQTVFPYPFPIFVDADMAVHVDASLQVPSADYTVTGAGDSTGGTVLFNSPPASGTVVTMLRNKAIARVTDFQESGEFRAKVINDELDILTALLQQVDDRASRSLHMGPTDPSSATELPGRAERLGRFLAFDTNGDPFASPGSVDTLAVSAFVATLLDDGDAAAARLTLGAVIGTDVLAPDGDGSNLTGIATGATVAERANIALNAFRIAVNGGLSVQNMADGVVDEFEDETGVDSVTSTNETYDATGDYYHNPGHAPLYANTGGAGARTGIITVTNDAGGLWGAFTGSELVDGTTAGSQGAWHTAVDVGGSWIKFDFGVAASKVITETKIYMELAASKGTWKWQGSDNDTDWTDIGSSFEITGSATFTDTAMAANAVGYRYYKLVGVSGTPSASWIREFEFKIDDYATPPDMTLVSEAFAALTQPADAFAVLWHETVDAVTLNTDLTACVSRDGGTTWTQATLTQDANLSGNEQVLTGSADISAQPAGTSIKWKIETLNNKEQRVRGVSMQWS